ncbi:MAG: AzlC family ABC transporter permease [Lachnospiraceae bacterium]|nr:AzlC family ABC transporter permease [Lachnospiraceae bacterium]
MKDGVPIGLGYLAVSFSLGIMAKSAGLTPFQGFLVSLLCNASAGEFAGFSVIAAAGSFLEMAMAILVANARYLLMGCALSQRMEPGLALRHRLIMAFDITDEVFAITIARPGWLNPYYTYGAMVTTMPFWAIGTALGVMAGNMLPANIVSAFSVALYGMFLAVIIPQAKKDKVVAVLIVISFALSYLGTYIPFIKDMSDGTKTIIFTILISAGAAILFPRKPQEES